MNISMNVPFIEGSFDTKTSEMVCVQHRKYLSVELCIKSDDGWNVPIGKLRLSSRDTVGAITPIYDDMCALGEEIARRWNECESKQ